MEDLASSPAREPDSPWQLLRFSVVAWQHQNLSILLYIFIPLVAHLMRKFSRVDGGCAMRCVHGSCVVVGCYATPVGLHGDAAPGASCVNPACEHAVIVRVSVMCTEASLIVQTLENDQ